MSALTLSQNMEDLRLVRAVTYSGYTLLVWDYLLTLDDEMTYIWDSPSSVVKYLFIGNRYVNLLVQAVYISEAAGVLPLRSNATCLAFTWVVGLAQTSCYSSVHILVLLRVWILYGRTRNITIALIAAFILYISANIGVFAYILSAINFPNPASERMCVAELPPFSWMIWIFELLLEACLFGLTIFTLRRQKSASEFPRVSRLIRSLYRHAIIFFLANTLSNTLNAVTWSVLVGTPLYDAANTSAITLVNITGQRLAIDLRRLHIQKDATQSEISRVVAFQLAALNNSDPAVP